jgi:hypothetical protein
MSAPTLNARVAPPALVGLKAHRVLERNLMVGRRNWILVLSGFFEPVFYLFSIGVGVGALVGDLQVAGRSISYAAFVAPALLASSAMNGAVFESTMNIFFKLKWGKVYDAMLATPLRPIDIAAGEIGYSLLRGGIYAVGFMMVMVAFGLAHSWWAVMAIPAALLIGFAFAAVGMAATTFMRSWQDFDLVQLVTLPLFLGGGSKGGRPPWESDAERRRQNAQKRGNGQREHSTPPAKHATHPRPAPAGGRRGVVPPGHHGGGSKGGRPPWASPAGGRRGVVPPSRGRDANLHGMGDLSLGIIGFISHIPQALPTALGAAMAFRYRSEPRVAVTFVGDGGTTAGPFHEVLNMASLWHAPLVTIVENNRYAYSTPLDQQMGSADFVAKAEANGVRGVVVDGNDVEAMYSAARTAIEGARSGAGPTLIQADTMRMLGHAIHDGAEYVPAELLTEWEAKDPLAVHRRRLLDEGVATAEALDSLDAAARARVSEAVTTAEAASFPDPDTVTDGVYA